MGIDVAINMFDIYDTVLEPSMLIICAMGQGEVKGYTRIKESPIPL